MAKSRFKILKTILIEGLAISVIGGLAALFFALQRKAGSRFNTFELASYVFAVSGTIVALILPAAELAGHLIISQLEYWARELAKAGNDPKEVATEGYAFLRATQKKSNLVRRGSIYVFFAFVGSAFALFTPQTLTAGTLTIEAAYVVLGVSLSLLLIGSSLFFPFAFHVYKSRVLSGTIQMFYVLSQKSAAKPSTDVQDPMTDLINHFWLRSVGSKPTDPERQTWVNKFLAVDAQTTTQRLQVAKELGRALFESAQYEAYERSDEEYVRNLYSAYFKRDPDTDGLARRRGVLGADPANRKNLRETVLAEFETSPEFENLLKGIFQEKPPAKP